MKILGILGSPHGIKGNTGRLMLEVIAGAEEAGAVTDTVVLPGGTVLPCRACDVCHRTGTCPQKDDFNAIREKVMDSDGVVLASPNYIYSVSAQLKAFMDRCCGVIHCMSFDGRYGASVVTSGGGDEEQIADFMNHYLITTGIIPVGSVWATMGNIHGTGFPDELLKEAHALGRKLVANWKSKVMSPEVEKEREYFTGRMRQLMQYRKDEWPHEYDYWMKHRGLTESAG